MSLEDIERRLRDYAAGKALVALYLFGSTAAGTDTRLSDVDVAVLLPEELPKADYLEFRLELAAELSQLLRTDAVDLVILNEAPPLLRHRAIIQGKLIYSGDDIARVRFEVRTLQEYLDVKPLLNLQTRRLRERLREGSFGVRS